MQKRVCEHESEQGEYLPPARPNTVCLLIAVQVAKMWKKRQCSKAFLGWVSTCDKSDDGDICISDVPDGFDEVFEPFPGLPSLRVVSYIIDTGSTEGEG